MSGAEYKSDLRFLLFEYRNCRTEDAEEWYQTVEDIFKEKDARIANLQSLIADAPHSISCKEGMRAWDSPTDFEVCSCWKSRALDTGAKG